jgi:hypothetical protein
MSKTVEDRQHAAVVSALTTHFSHSSVESDIEDAAWTVLNVLDDFLIPDPSAFPKLTVNMATTPEWEEAK